MEWAPILGLIGACAIAWAATGALPTLLERLAVIDTPNERSSHARPTPRGGGIAVLAAVAICWFVAAPPGLLPLLALGLALGAVGWWDDVRGLPATFRLAAQAGAVGAGLALADIGPVFQGFLPASLDRALAALVWLWFVNLFNFMDGIDGIAGTEAATIALGLAWATAATVPGGGLAEAAIAGAALGFLAWNWPPAKIFLGDVGSQALGFLLGFLLLRAAGDGQWAIALILPLYFLADATLTLLRRLFAGEAVWRAHRSHAYQRAVRALGGAHRPVLLKVLALDAALLALAILVVAFPGFAFGAVAIGAAATAALLWRFERLARGADGR